jgi:predicted ATPase/DNA-binding SARP family transcriptional activator/DNA-binding CsgD family transcriptional regulator
VVATRSTQQGATPSLRIMLLGGFHLWVGDRRVPPDALRRRKAARLIKLLALAPGYRLLREQVLEALWPTLEPDAAANNLHRTLYVARRILDPDVRAATLSSHLALNDGSLCLCAPGGLWTDAHAFELAASAARQFAEPMYYHQALDLYTGDVLPEESYEDWAIIAREKLRVLYLTLLEELALLYERLNDPQGAIATLQRVTEHEPTNEQAQVKLMRLYAQVGQRHKALRQFQQLRHILQRDLGVEPAASAERLYHELALDQDVDTSGDDLPRPTPNTSRSNLPHQLTSFVGREAELREVSQVVRKHRLVVLTGPGGCGKTRLALEAVRTVAPYHPDGIWFIDLSSTDSPSLVLRAVTSALRIKDEPGQSALALLVEHIGAKHMLLILDNCEHVVEICVSLVEELLNRCPHAYILATSREVLRIPGEVRWLVPPLPVPALVTTPTPDVLTTYDAVRLLVDRARLVQPDFTLTQHNARAVVELCQRLDGMPLAIELAAASLHVLSPSQLVARLDDRFRLLRNERRTGPPRHQGLEQVTAWSYGLLDHREQALFSRLGIFTGSWTLEEAEHIVAGPPVDRGDVLGLLARLVDKSLVVAEVAVDGTMRYRLHETLRDYALARLSEAGALVALQRSHADYYCLLAEQVESGLQEADQEGWLRRLEAVRANVQAALSWSVQGEDRVATGLRTAASLWLFWLLSSSLEQGREWLARLLRRYSVADTIAAKAVAVAGFLAWAQHDLEHAAALLEDSIQRSRTLGEHRLLAWALNNLGQTRFAQGDVVAAETFYAESLALSEALGEQQMSGWAHANLGDLALYRCDLAHAAEHYTVSLAAFRTLANPFGVGVALVKLGSMAQAGGNDAQALTHYAESLHIFRTAGIQDNIAWLLHLEGEVRLYGGDVERAEALQRESLALFQLLDNNEGSAWALNGLAQVAQLRGDHAHAASLFRESLGLHRFMFGHRYIVLNLLGLAGVALRQGDARRAAQLLAGIAMLGDTVGGRLMPAEQIEFEHLRSRIGMDGVSFATLDAQTRALPLHELIAYALREAEHDGVPHLAPPKDVAVLMARLTRREREVAKLIVRGYINRQIAIELGVSERTVDTHVSNILHKLHVRSRAALAGLEALEAFG